jgi:tyrosine phenol-lyase
MNEKPVPLNTMGMQRSRRSWAEPYKIKSVELLHMTTREQRETALAEAGWNTFLLRSEDVYIDLLTDSGTNAMSDRQWAGMMLGDESYAGSVNFYNLEAAIRKYYGYKHIVPTHQGRGAEHLLSQSLIEKGDTVPGNMYFTTTRFHQEYAGAEFIDVVIPEAHDPESEHPFKGNVDLEKLEEVLKTKKVPYICVAATVNLAGGQPISMANAKATYALAKQYGTRVYMDATRAIENAHFIKVREEGYADKTLAEILLEFSSYSDGATMSGKKDPLVNIGGWLALNDDDVFERARNMVVVFEGLHTYGGMAGRDMEAMARGIEEAVQDDHMAARIGQVEYLHELLSSWGVPVVKPCGGHAVFLDAKQFYLDMPQAFFPAQTLAGELYLDRGVRSMERGIVSAGRDAKTGHDHAPKLELVRLTIPRRVYTQAHMDVVAESVADVFFAPTKPKGLEWEYEPKFLRFFLGRFKPIQA